jgi:hypothetical protein
MKSLLLSTVILLSAFAGAFAQEIIAHADPDFIGSEVIVGHGIFPSDQVFENGARRTAYNTSQYTGAIAATYRYHISHVVSLGLSFAYENEQGTFTDNSYNYNYNYYYASGNYPANYFNSYGTFRRSSFTIAPEVTFNYGDFAHGFIRLYGVFGMGYTFRNELLTDAGTNAEYTSPYINRVHVNAYGSPLGVRFGHQLGGYFELGLGYRGVFNYGLTYRS